MNNELLLLSKNDIPFIEAQVNIHQPTISEISLIGEENFFTACQLINFNKNKLSDEDKLVLADKTDFEIFMSIMSSKERVQHRNSVLMLLALVFPNYQIKMTQDEIILFSADNSTRINNTNYDTFRNIIVKMFGLNESEGTGGGYNPADKRAEKIAEKLERARAKRNKSIDGQQKVAVFSRYISILSVGENKDMNVLMQYTVFQLLDEFKRYQMKVAFDGYVAARLAGAKDLEEVDHWMNDIHGN
jgi:hypothetical protein